MFLLFITETVKFEDFHDSLLLFIFPTVWFWILKDVLLQPI